jgi:hypothetical protein
LKKALSGKANFTPEMIMETLSREYGWTPDEIRDQRIEDISAYLDILSARNSLIKQKDV